MTLYAADEDGAVVCIDCIYGVCVGRGPCEAEACQCDCNRDENGALVQRAREADDREPNKLTVIANELDRERYDPAALVAERFGGGRRA